MKIYQKSVETILEQMKEIFNSVEYNRHFSALVTGSVARGDVRVNKGKIESDIDILLFVKNEQDLLMIKKEILSKKRKFSIPVALIFTLSDCLKKNGTRGYLRNVKTEYLLYDGLGIKDKILNLEKESHCNDSISLFQELSYYYSKYEVCSYEYLKDKILKIWTSISNEITVDLPTKEEILKYLKDEKKQVLNSTKVFLKCDAINDPIKKHNQIKNLVFIENQGLPLAKSYYEL